MKSSLSRRLLAAAAAGILFCSGAAVAGPLVTLKILGSTTGANGTYSSNITTTPGTTINYEVLALYADPSATQINSNTTRTPNGTTDTFSSLTFFNLTGTSGTFVSSQLTAPVQGTGSSAGSISTSTLSGVRAVGITGPNVNVNADAPGVVILTGTYTVPADATITGSTVTNGTSGSLRVAGSPVAITTAAGGTEVGSDPLIAYAPLTVAVPEPASLSLLGLGALGLLRRSRRRSSATV